MELIIREHPNYRKEVTIAMQCVNFLPVTTEKTKNIYGWIDCWLSNGLPFNFYENELPRQYTKLLQIFYKTLVIYMTKTVKEVEKLSHEMPSSFGLIIDGWSVMATSTHFIGVFAVYSARGERKLSLLGFAPLVDEDIVECRQSYRIHPFCSGSV